MTYNANIPQATDLISSSQSQILGNFQALNSLFGAFNQVTFTESSDPTPPAGDTSIIYTEDAASGSVFFYNPSGPVASPVPWFINAIGAYPMIPDLKLTTTGSYSNYSFQIGPLLFNFGRRLQASGTTSYSFTFQQAFGTAVLFRIASADGVQQKNNSYEIPATGSLSGLSINFSSSTTAGANSYVYYLAIGY